MADPKLPQKLIRENPFKRFITRLILLAFLNQNLAFATQSIIELDVQGSQTSQRLHTILPRSNIADVSHIEIDTEKRQVSVHRIENTKLPEEGKDASLVHSEVIKTHPVIIPSHDVQNLPWDLEPEKLTLFILSHTAWLSPVDEDGYKLEFRGALLGGMMKGGGGNSYKGVTSDGKGGFELNVPVVKYVGLGGGGVSKGTSSGGSGWQSVLGKPWAKIEANGDQARDRMQKQQENLKKLSTVGQPVEIYKRKDIVIPDNPFPRVRPPQPVQPLPKDWEGKVAMIDKSFFRLSWNEMYYLARGLGVPDQVITDWRNYRASNKVTLVSYLETKKKIDIEKAKKEEDQLKKEKLLKEQKAKEEQIKKEIDQKNELEKKENPFFYGEYEHIKHLQKLINTESWENVFKYADKAGISKEDVLKIDRKENMTFEGFMKKTNPFYPEYEKLKHVQKLINTASWQAVYDYANKQGFSKEDVQYVNSRRTETITFDNYMKGVFDDQVLEDWGAKDWKEAFRSDEGEPQIMQVNLVKDILKLIPPTTKLIQKSWQKAVQAYKGDLVKGLKIDKSVENKLTQELGKPYLSRDAKGLRWGDIKGNNQVRIMKGNPKSPYSHEQVDYVQLRSGGQVVLKDGTKIKNPANGQELRKLKDAHVSYEEWVKWKSWNKP